MHILVTGGAGYIGSHTVETLLESGHRVTVLDNLSTGFKEAVNPAANLIVGDVCDLSQILSIFSAERVDAIIHFAAKLVVPESIEKPIEYYENNLGGVLALVKACKIAKVDKIVFSSTAAVYGEVSEKINELAKLQPISPYGKSKLMSEEVLRDADRAFGIRNVCLRYFNVAGAKASGGNGQRTKDATHLIKVASEAAVGKRPVINVFGHDYPTKDGTCVRDYIHVEDLADIHVLVLEYLLRGGQSEIFNCGYGHGYSVNEVLGAMQNVSGTNFLIKAGARRPGDPSELVSDSTKVKKVLGWQPKFNNINFICKSAYDWERSLTL